MGSEVGRAGGPFETRQSSPSKPLVDVPSKCRPACGWSGRFRFAGSQDFCGEERAGHCLPSVHSGVVRLGRVSHWCLWTGWGVKVGWEGGPPLGGPSTSYQGRLCALPPVSLPGPSSVQP